MRTYTRLAPLSSEYRDADLGDARLTTRACMIADAAAQAPGGSLPSQASSDSALEGTYRFFSNPRVKAEAVLDAHVRCTVQRAAEMGEVLVLHDTTKLEFGGEMLRDGLGPVSGPTTQGFLAHTSFAVGLDGKPLGILGLFAYARRGEAKGKRAQQISQYDPDRESLRWMEAVDATGERVFGQAEVIHVMDREGDCIEGVADQQEHGHRFVIRLAHDRRLQDGRQADKPKLYATLHAAPLLMRREVLLSRRGDKGRAPRQRAKVPTRSQRLADLSVRAQRLTIWPGNGSVAHLPASLTLNFVEVCEDAPPQDVEPVLWRLVTTEPIDTPEDVARVVDIYRRRWLIEELFKALKTGCNFEKLQLESGSSLMVALSIFISVAWRLLLLRWMDRKQPEAPAEAVVTPLQLVVLRAVRAKEGKPLPKDATVGDVFEAIAALGAHLKNNGKPGWRVLGRGFDKLLVMEQTAIALLYVGADP